MAWEDILKDDVDTFNKLLKDIKETQKKLKDVHRVISRLIYDDIMEYSQVYGGFLPKSLIGEVLGITDEYEMTDDKLEKLMKKVAEMMAIYAKRNNPML